MSESNGNGKTNRTEIVHVKALGLQEKREIGKLVDRRASGLNSYLKEMQSFADEANENLPFSKQGEITALDAEMAKLEIEQQKISTKKATEERAVNRLFEEERDRKLHRLKTIEMRINQKYKEEKEAADKTIAKKYDRREAKLAEKKVSLKDQQAALKAEEKQERMIRKVALANSFNALRDGIGDAQNEANEKIWTDVQTPHDAKDALHALPDASEFRKQVTPQKLFGIFNTNIAGKALPLAKAQCSSCGGNDIAARANGDYYCRGCGSYQPLDDEVQKLIALPTLSEIVESSRQPALPAPSMTDMVKERLGRAEPKSDDIEPTDCDPQEALAAAVEAEAQLQ